MLVNPAFIRGRSFIRNFFDLLDNGSEEQLLGLKTKLKALKGILDDPDVIAKSNDYIRYIDEELLLRQDLAFVKSIEESFEKHKK